MNIYHDDIVLQTVIGRPSYHDIKQHLIDFVKKSNIKDGLITVSSAHTTCSL